MGSYTNGFNYDRRIIIIHKYIPAVNRFKAAYLEELNLACLLYTSDAADDS